MNISSYRFNTYDNTHITPPNVVSLNDWFNHAHSLDEINAKLRVGLPNRFNDEGTEDYHITDVENADYDKGLTEFVTPYEKEKVKHLKEINHVEKE